jgi:hypothetical protein
LSARPARELKADVAIIGGGLGGVAAALAALRHGLTVVMTEETDWIGGQLTSQAVPPDEHRWVETHGITKTYRDFRNKVRDYYRQHRPLTETAKKKEHLNPGEGSVSRLCHEPLVAFAVLQAMLQPYLESKKLKLLTEYIPIAADAQGDVVRSVTVRDRAGMDTTIAATYFLDATELGDLLPLTNTEFVTGAESQKDTAEMHAPATAQPDNQQAFTICFIADFVPEEDNTISKPREYDFWRDYVPTMTPPWPGKLLSWSMSDPVTLKERKVFFDPTTKAKGPGLNLWVYRRIACKTNFLPNDPAEYTLVNWPQNDYWLGNLVGVSLAEKQRHIDRGKQLSLSLMYWMQTEAPRPDGGTGWKGLKLRPDLMRTTDGLAKHPYIRESRRIKAEFTVLEQHVGKDARMKETGQNKDEVKAAHFKDSCGIGYYRIDLHPSTGGDNYIDVDSLPFQIPLGALIPQRMNNLLPACKNLGVTHITNGCYRLHPVEWNIGEAAGALAAMCVKQKLQPRQVRNDAKLLDDFQAMLQKDGVELAWR